MAQRSSAFYGNPGAEYQSLYLDFWVIDQDYVLNRTRFGYRALIQGNTSGAYGSTGSGSYNFSGAMSVSAGGRSWSWSYTSGVVIAEGEFYLTHGSDGTLSAQTLALSVSAPGVGSAYVDVTIGISDIPRQSKVKEFNSFFIDAVIPVRIEKSVSTYRHTVYLQVWDSAIQGWVTVTSIANIDTGVDFLLTAVQQDEIYKRMPNSMHKAVRVWLETFNGSKYMGSDAKAATAYARSTLKPTIGGMSFYDTVASSRAIGAFVQGISKIRTTLTGLSGIRYSTVEATEIWQNGAKGDPNNPATMAQPIILSGNVGVLGKVIDSRGQVGEQAQTIPVLAYNLPTIELMQVSRCESSGKDDPIGTYLKIRVKGTRQALMVNDVDKNTGELNVYIGPKGGALTKRNTKTAGATFDITLVLGTYAINSEFEVLAEVSDKFSVQPAKMVVRKGKALFVMGKEGCSFGTMPSPATDLVIGPGGVEMQGPFKYETIPLTLMNGAIGGTGADEPKAYKIGNLVFISGFIQPASSGLVQVATLPVGWRPNSNNQDIGVNLDTQSGYQYWVNTSGALYMRATAQRLFVNLAYIAA